MRRRRFHWVSQTEKENKPKRRTQKMPRSKNPLIYDEAFHDFIRTAAIQEVTVPCGTEKAAISMRGRLYGFHSALERAAREGGGRASDKEWAILRRLSCKVQYYIEGPNLVARPRDMSPIVSQLRNSINAAEAGRSAAGSDNANLNINKINKEDKTTVERTAETEPDGPSVSLLARLAQK